MALFKFVLLCKYLSTYFFLTHKWKLNFYLPLPIPFQMLFFVFELFFVLGLAHAPRH